MLPDVPVPESPSLRSRMHTSDICLVRMQGGLNSFYRLVCLLAGYTISPCVLPVSPEAQWIFH